MKFKVGDRVIIDKVKSGIVIEPLPIDYYPISVPGMSSAIRDGNYVRVRYDTPRNFVSCSLHWIGNLELDIEAIRKEKLNKLL